MSEFKNTEKKEENNEQPKLCVKCCTFFGNKERAHMCSKCYKDTFGDLATKPEPKTEEVQAEQVKKEEEIKQETDEKEPEEPTKKVQEDKSKCFTCAKKVGIMTSYKCKCDYVFCKRHRLPEEHDCDFDFKDVQRKKLAEANQKVVASKMEQF